MTSVTLYRKYRPQAWAEVSAQNHVKTTLAFEVATGKIAHAYLFAGPRGVGKTTTARILAKALNCIERAKLQPSDPAKGDPCGTCESCVAITEGTALDVIEMDAASNRGIDNVREHIVAGARFTPARFAYKVFIIDEVHMLTTEAFNALLKTLEEPPAHVVFILATTETHKVPATILSRCQRFDFRKIPFVEMVERLHKLSEREGVKVDKRALEEIARNADGGLRDAESLLGKVLALGDGKRLTYDEAMVALPRTDVDAIANLVDALLHRDAQGALTALHQAIDDGSEPEHLADGTIESLRTALVAKLGGGPDAVAFNADEPTKKRIADNAAIASVEELVSALEICLSKRRDMKTAHPTQLPFEIAIVRICERLGAEKDLSSQGTLGSTLETTTAPSLRAQRPAAPSHVSESNPQASTAPPVIASVAKQSQPPVIPAHEPEPADPSASQTEFITPAIIMDVTSVATDEPPTSTAQQLADPEHSRRVNSSEPLPPITTVEKLQSSWTEFMTRAGELNAGMPFLLAAGRPHEVEGHIIRIGFQYGFHKDKMNQEKNRRILETVLTTMFGQDCRIEGVVLEKSLDIVHTHPATFAPTPQPALATDNNVLTVFGGRLVE